jgi:hypothetical protein
MTKSRTALHARFGPFLALLFCWPGPAAAQPGPPISAEALLAAYDARVHEAMGNVDGARSCPRDAQGDDAIIVCGRNHDASMRLPLPVQPEPGARHRLIAGELPSARDALGVGQACCGGGGGINLLGLAGALAHGVDRILHPD